MNTIALDKADALFLETEEYILNLLNKGHLAREYDIKDEKMILGGCYAAIHNLGINYSEYLTKDWGSQKDKDWDERWYCTQGDLISLRDELAGPALIVPVGTPLPQIVSKALGVSLRQAREWITSGVRLLPVDWKYLLIIKGRGASRETRHVKFINANI